MLCFLLLTWFLMVLAMNCDKKFKSQVLWHSFCSWDKKACQPVTLIRTMTLFTNMHSCLQVEIDSCCSHGYGLMNRILQAAGLIELIIKLTFAGREGWTSYHMREGRTPFHDLASKSCWPTFRDIWASSPTIQSRLWRSRRCQVSSHLFRYVKLTPFDYQSNVGPVITVQKSHKPNQMPDSKSAIRCTCLERISGQANFISRPEIRQTTHAKNGLLADEDWC